MTLRTFPALAILAAAPLLVACTSHVVSGTGTGHGKIEGSGGSGGGDATTTVTTVATGTGGFGGDSCGPPPSSTVGSGGSYTSTNPGDGCANDGDYVTCSINSPDDGYEVCEPDSNGDLVWSICMPQENGTSSVAATPLVFVFDGAPVDFEASSASFGLVEGACVATDWPSARTPWLALDRDGSGAIEDGAELFGSMTKLSSGGLAKNGFEALAELDSNHDGVIDANDAAFSKLVLWSDANGDRASSASELSSLASKKIRSIDLKYTTAERCDARGNCERERATFTYEENGSVKTGAVVDVWLAYR